MADRIASGLFVASRSRERPLHGVAPSWSLTVLCEGARNALIFVVCLVHRTYFSGMKLRWMLDNVAAVAEGAANGTALFGTIETWLIWNLSGGVEGGIHVSDVSNASRTMLMDLASCAWHKETCTTLDIPMAMLP